MQDDPISHNPDTSKRRYLSFWDGVGETFPDLAGAWSTDYYRLDEQRLFREHLGDLGGLKVLKTDLWDEAKNTRILRWAARQGAVAYGVDISLPIVEQAADEFAHCGERLRAAQGDVRAIPYADSSFDVIYSMGTVEHFDETTTAVAEIFRVLKPGGTAIVGVPNRWDPFLRPLMVAAMYRTGLYGYGFEKSYSRRGLRDMLRQAGFEIVAETGILFVPGWLRILDLACNAWARPLSAITGAACWPFSAVSRAFPFLQRHGYLLATVARRPE
jgi:SAM-dependent methyltransferase